MIFFTAPVIYIMTEYAIEFKNVSKIYKLKDKEKKKFGKATAFYAIKDISFCIPKGEVVGILGTNGSGKSTMALLLAGISSPNEGEIIVRGEQALISISTGLSSQLTGLENIELKGALLGLKRQRIDEIIDGVIEFAELGEFLYQPVKKYSSGMKSRLGFAINLCLNTDILIIDEALSVGDKGFAHKCLKRMNEIKKDGKTIIFISHSLAQVVKYCDTAIWIEGGIMREYDEVDGVAERYSEYVDRLNDFSTKEKKAFNDEKFKKRLVNDMNENSIDKAMHFFQKHFQKR